MTYDNEAIVRYADHTDGKIGAFNCSVGFSSMFTQMGVQPDFASAVSAPVAAR